MADELMNATSTTELAYAIPEIWSKDLIFEATRQTFWHKFYGPQGSRKPIIRKDDLMKVPGDRVNIQTCAQLTGDGVTSESGVLKGNEELLSIGQLYITLGERRHAVAYTKRAKQRINFEVRETAKNVLANWLAEKMDADMFSVATNGFTNTLYGGNATSVGDLGTDDTLSCAVLDRIKVEMLMQRALPVNVMNESGKESDIAKLNYYILVVHPYDAHNLKQDETWREAQQYANIRGEKNPLFTGALGVYNGIIVYENEGVYNSSSKSKCLAFGGEALARAFGQEAEWTEDEDDYKHRMGIEVDVVYGDKVAVTDNSVLVNTYAENPNA